MATITVTTSDGVTHTYTVLDVVLAKFVSGSRQFWTKLHRIEKELPISELGALNLAIDIDYDLGNG